ncbi:hypothetical protein JHK85_054138 [Glycine max]|nr:hypothetical protein JHK85_054138 [Glycine max]
MDSVSVQIATSKFVLCPAATASSKKNAIINFSSNFKGTLTKIHAISPNGSASSCTSRVFKTDKNKGRSNLESLFCYDKAIPEEIIEKPVGLSLEEKAIGNNPDALIARPKVLCFVPLVLVLVYMLTP